jgi:branched-chain amino acid transport system substrate-binding protein
MRRTRRWSIGAAALAAVAAFALSACGAKEAGAADATAAADLAIVPTVQIDIEGRPVESASSGQPADPAGDGTATCDGIAIAMAGPLTGPEAALGLNIIYGAQVAINEHNEANPDCQVALKQFDTQGDPQNATQVAPQIVGDSSVIALLGPAFSGETKATGAIFSQAGLLSLTASATNPDLTGNGWATFYRGLANDAVQGPAVAKYMVNTLGYDKVCVVQDNTDYGAGLAEQITTALGAAADPSCAAQVKKGDKDYAATVQLISGADADAVFYAGYYPEAAPFVQQLRDGQVEIPFISADGTNDPQFVAQAGSSADGAILSCPCGPAPADFAAAYEETNGQPPGVYSTEGYDLTTIMLSGIDSGITDRAALLDYVKNYSGDGLARHYQWDSTGELTSGLVWIYTVQ